MTFSLAQLQKEQIPWVEHNFGFRPNYHPFLGMVEELGELADACKKWEVHHAEKGSDHWMEFVAEARDAVADFVIFMCDYCTRAEIKLLKVESTPPLPAHSEEKEVSDDLKKRDLFLFSSHLQSNVGMLSHHYLKREQGIRGNADYHLEESSKYVHRLVRLLDLLCAVIFDCTLLEVVEPVWKEVKKRDWKKNPQTA